MMRADQRVQLTARAGKTSRPTWTSSVNLWRGRSPSAEPEFANLEAAMNAEFKKSASEEFAGKIAGMVETIAGITLTLGE